MTNIAESSWRRGFLVRGHFGAAPPDQGSGPFGMAKPSARRRRL